MNLKMENRRVDGVTVLDLSGRIVVGEEIHSLRETLVALAKNGEKTVLLNLAKVDYIDSSGLALLLTGNPRPGQHRKFQLLNPTRRVQNLLAMTRLRAFFEVFEDEGRG